MEPALKKDDPEAHEHEYRGEGDSGCHNEPAKFIHGFFQI